VNDGAERAKEEQWQRSVRRLLALRAMGWLRPEQAVEWAVEALVLGQDTPNLRVLAGLTKVLCGSEVDHYLDLTLAELGVVAKEGDACVLSYVRDVAHRIVEGSMVPGGGCETIYRASMSLGQAPELADWLYLVDGLEPGTYKELSGANLDRAIVRAARRLLNGQR
jgi:hypothetical protein